jgi:hypothetical protein
LQVAVATVTALSRKLGIDNVKKIKLPANFQAPDLLVELLLIGNIFHVKVMMNGFLEIWASGIMIAQYVDQMF